MTGLDETQDKIIEVAAIFTNWDFDTVEEYHRVVYQPQEVLDSMNKWCKKTHGESGLTESVPNGTPLDEVEDDLLAIFDRFYPSDYKVVIAGNSISVDRKFIDHYMPKLAARLHYRMVDVSSFKEIFRRKYGAKIEKKGAHRAVDDIKESIRELKFYLSFLDHDKLEKVGKSSGKRS